jgi:hypothetical protein
MCCGLLGRRVGLGFDWLVWRGGGCKLCTASTQCLCGCCGNTLLPPDVGTDFPCLFSTAAGGWAGPGH